MAGPRMTAERAYELARAGVKPEQIGDVDIREQVYSVLNDPELSPAERLEAATALSQSEGAGGPAGDELRSTYRAPGLGQAAVGAVGILGTMEKSDFSLPSFGKSVDAVDPAGGPAEGSPGFDVVFSDAKRGFALVRGLGEGWGVPGSATGTRKIQIGDYLPGGLAVTDITYGGIQVIPESKDEFAPPSDEYVIPLGGKTQVYKPQPKPSLSADIQAAKEQHQEEAWEAWEFPSDPKKWTAADMQAWNHRRKEEPRTTISADEAGDTGGPAEDPYLPMADVVSQEMADFSRELESGLSTTMNLLVRQRYPDVSLRDLDRAVAKASRRKDFWEGQSQRKELAQEIQVQLGEMIAAGRYADAAKYLASVIDAPPPADLPTVERRIPRRGPAVLPWDEPSGAIPDWLSRQDEAVTGGVIRRHLESPIGLLDKIKQYDTPQALQRREQRRLQGARAVLWDEQMLGPIPEGLLDKIKQYDAPLFEQMFGAAGESESSSLAILRGNPAYRRQFEDTIQMFKYAPGLLPPLPDTPISEIAGAEDLTDSERASRLAAHEGLVWMHQKRDEIRRDIESGEIGIQPQISDKPGSDIPPAPTQGQRDEDARKLEESMWFETEEGEGGPEEEESVGDWWTRQALQVGEGVRRTGEWIEGQAEEFSEAPGEYYAKKIWPLGRIIEAVRRYEAGESLMEATDAEAMLIAADMVDPTMISQIAAVSLYEAVGDHEAAAITLGAGLAGVGVGVLAAKLARMSRANKIALEARGITGEAADEATSRVIRDAHRGVAPGTYGPLKKFGREPGGRAAMGDWEATRHLAKPQGRVVLPDGVEVQYWRHPDYPDQVIRERIEMPGDPPGQIHQTVEIMPIGRWVDEAFGPRVRSLDLGDPISPGIAEVPARSAGPGRTRRSPEAGTVEPVKKFVDVNAPGFSLKGVKRGNWEGARHMAEKKGRAVLPDGTEVQYWIHPDYPDQVIRERIHKPGEPWIPGDADIMPLKRWVDEFNAPGVQRLEGYRGRAFGSQGSRGTRRSPEAGTAPMDPDDIRRGLHKGYGDPPPAVRAALRDQLRVSEDIYDRAGRVEPGLGQKRLDVDYEPPSLRERRIEYERLPEGHPDMPEGGQTSWTDFGAISRTPPGDWPPGMEYEKFVGVPGRDPLPGPQLRGRQITPPPQSTLTTARVVEDPKRYWNTELDKANQRLREHRAFGGKADPDVEIQILQDIDEINEALWELGPRYPVSPPLPRGQ